MNTELKLPKENDLADNVNVIRLLNRINELERRVAKLENKEQVSKSVSKVWSWESYILEVLGNGKIWSTHAIVEELQLLHPNLKNIKHPGVQTACGTLARRNKIDKITHGNYRLKKEA